MARQLPPLNALRAFEATARHLSIREAADELCVTPGAVSQSVKALEAFLGLELFRRANRGISLTEAGRDYLPAIRSAFRQITEATGRLTARAESGILTVSVPPYFAASWLVPRLRSFQEAHPEISLQVNASRALTDFGRDGTDLAIRHGLGQYPGLCAIRILALELVPVAAPGLVSRLGVPESPEVLATWPLVHEAERRDWSLWFQAQSIVVPDVTGGPAFNDIGLAINAVLSEQGAGLVPDGLVAQHLAERRLIRLSDAAWPLNLAYYLVYPETHESRPKVAAFREWIVAAAGSGAGQPA